MQGRCIFAQDQEQRSQSCKVDAYLHRPRSRGASHARQMHICIRPGAKELVMQGRCIFAQDQEQRSQSCKVDAYLHRTRNRGASHARQMHICIGPGAEELVMQGRCIFAQAQEQRSQSCKVDAYLHRPRSRGASHARQMHICIRPGAEELVMQGRCIFAQAQEQRSQSCKVDKGVGFTSQTKKSQIQMELAMASEAHIAMTNSKIYKPIWTTFKKLIRKLKKIVANNRHGHTSNPCFNVLWNALPWC